MQSQARRIRAFWVSAIAATFAFLVALPLGLSATQGATQPEKAQPAARRQIFAIGGDGLEKAGSPHLLMKYFLGLTGKKQPRVCFMPAASGDSKAAINRWNASVKGLDCQPKVQKVYIASPSTKSFEAELLQADAIYVDNGNALNMLAIWKAHGIDKIMRQAYDKGIVLGGEGAGAMCWFEQGSTDSRPGKLSVMDGLGFLKGSFCTDYDGDRQRRPSYQEWIGKGEIKGGIAADNGVGVLYVNETLDKVVGANGKAQAYRVGRTGDKAREEAVKGEVLGK